VARLETNAWPGNVRELGTFVRRAVALSRGGEIGVEALDHGKSLNAKSSSGSSLSPLSPPTPDWKPGDWKPGPLGSAKWSASFLP